MKLHHLTLGAFGPFAGVETIDFDDLTRDGLFLIHGPTGAGKSTVLDAVCFALYGKVPGSRAGQRDSLVSDHAPCGTRPFVRLEFTVGARRLRIERSLAYQAPKKRGTGTTERKATQTLQELGAGTWTVLSTRPDEVGDVIVDLLGMQVDQFAQVVLLPQGEFAAFLRATADERAAVLRRLFDIQRFEDVERWFSQERSRLRTRLETLDSQLHSQLARAESAIVEVEPESVVTAWDRADAAALLTSITQLHERLDAQVSSLMVVEDDARRARVKAEVAVAEGSSTLDWQRRAATAQTEVDAWSAAADTRAERTHTLHRARRAAEVRPHIAIRHQAEHACTSALLAADDARRAATAMGLPGDAELESLRSYDEAVLDIDGAVRSLSGAMTSRSRRLGEQTAAAAELVTAAAALTAAESELAQTATDLEDAEGRVDVARAGSALVDAWEQACRVARELDEAQQTRTATTQAAVDKLAAAQLAEQHAHHLRSLRIAGMAAELAADLAEEAPCPVCGSCTHPQLATPDADAVSGQQVDAADVASRAAFEMADRARATQVTAQAAATVVGDRLQAATASVQQALVAFAEAHAGPLSGGIELEYDLPDGICDRLDHPPDGSSSPSDVVSFASELEQGCAALPGRVPTLVYAQQEVSRCSRLHDAATRAAARATTARANAVAACTAAGDQLGEAERDLAEADVKLRMTVSRHGGCPCYAALRAPDMAQVGAEELLASAKVVVGRHRAAVSAVEAAAARMAAATAAENRLSGATASLATALAAADFDTAADVANAHLDADAIEAIERELNQARSVYDAARGVLAQDEAQAAAGVPTPDLRALESSAADARAAATHARDQIVAARRALVALTTLRDEAAGTIAATERICAQHAVVDRLADAFSGNGDNIMRMRLTSYVLAARLETVTDLANEHLARMSEGRFQLTHSDGREARGRKSGLGLLVVDSWTGTSRDPATLSGGEGFMASLALALGLGDAVLHEAGGRTLQTLLVDEGFGSLDDDSLELVIGVLDTLRSGGRDVGMVSHVAELRGRIPHRLEVCKSDAGSTTSVHSTPDSPAA